MCFVTFVTSQLFAKIYIVVVNIYVRDKVLKKKFKNLQLYLSLGMKLTKIHRILKFKQSDMMKNYTDFNTRKRMNAANDFEKDFFIYIILE